MKRGCCLCTGDLGVANQAVVGNSLVDTDVLPQEPHPRVREGSRWKLYRSPMAPWEAGVLICRAQLWGLPC